MFARAEKRFFDKVTPEERYEMIRDLQMERNRRIHQLARGKNYVAINRSDLNLMRMSRQRIKYTNNLQEFEFQRLQAQQRRERMQSQNAYEREYLAVQYELRKRMKRALVSALEDEHTLNMFDSTWMVAMYFLDIMSSLRDYVTARRTRQDNIERVEKP